jgi:hypothetical protein
MLGGNEPPGTETLVWSLALVSQPHAAMLHVLGAERIRFRGCFVLRDAADDQHEGRMHLWLSGQIIFSPLDP